MVKTCYDFNIINERPLEASAGSGLSGGKVIMTEVIRTKPSGRLLTAEAIKRIPEGWDPLLQPKS